jgi:hypothetical protein
MPMPEQRDYELDSLRIRQFATLRRATYRSRSHAIIAALACAGAALQLGWLALRRASVAASDWRPWLFATLAHISVLGTIWFIRRATNLHRQAKQTLLPEPTSPPEFSSLSDGSHVAKNLEEIR